MKCYAYDNADRRRRDRRRALSEAWKREHGIPDIEHQLPPTVSSQRCRKPVSRVQVAVNPINFGYRVQIERAAEYHQKLDDERRRAFSRKVKSPYGFSSR